MSLQPLLADFGLAKPLHDLSASTAVTLEGQYLGTPGYWSPEQALGELEAVDERSDV